jgi:hypothetical protein
MTPERPPAGAIPCRSPPGTPGPECSPPLPPRWGQDNRFGYGEGLTLCGIDTISEDEYSDVPLFNLTLAGAAGPHTYSELGDGRAVVDFYNGVFSPLAWLHRIRHRI